MRRIAISPAVIFEKINESDSLSLIIASGASSEFHLRLTQFSRENRKTALARDGIRGRLRPGRRATRTGCDASDPAAAPNSVRIPAGSRLRRGEIAASRDSRPGIASLGGPDESARLGRPCAARCMGVRRLGGASVGARASTAEAERGTRIIRHIKHLALFFPFCENNYRARLFISLGRAAFTFCPGAHASRPFSRATASGRARPDRQDLGGAIPDTLTIGIFRFLLTRGPDAPACLGCAARSAVPFRALRAAIFNWPPLVAANDR